MTAAERGANVSDIDAKLSLHAGGCGVYQYQPCTCLSAGAAREVAALREEVGRLRALVETAYREGWTAGERQVDSYGESRGYVEDDWRDSEARKSLASKEEA